MGAKKDSTLLGKSLELCNLIKNVFIWRDFCRFCWIHDELQLMILDVCFCQECWFTAMLSLLKHAVLHALELRNYKM